MEGHNLKKTWVGLSLILVLMTFLGVWGVYRQGQSVEINDEAMPSAGYVLDDESQKLIDDVARLETFLVDRMGMTEVNLLNHATLAFIRSKDYGYRSEGVSGMVWASYAGSLIEETGIDTEEFPEVVDEIIRLTDGMSYMKDPLIDVSIDFPHMMAVVDLLYTRRSDIPYEEAYNDYLLSWGGDLETFLLNMEAYSHASGLSDYESLYRYASDMMGQDEASYFSEEDYYADLDAVGIHQLIKEDMLVSEALNRYYRSGLFLERETRFIEAHGGESGFREAVSCFMLGEIPSQYLGDDGFKDHLRALEAFKRLMRTMMFDGEDEPSDVARQAAVDAFVALVLEGNR